MDKNRLLEFIRLIVLSGAGEGPLRELADILETQGEIGNAMLVRQTMDDYNEVKDAVRESGFLTELELNIAHRRAENRREWEKNPTRCS